MKLTTQVVMDLARIKAKIASYSDQEKELTKEIKRQMDKEKLKEFAPRDCPHKIVYNKFKKSTVSWKDEWTRLAKKYVHSWKRILGRLIEDSKEPSSSLNLELNEHYKEKK